MAESMTRLVAFNHITQSGATAHPFETACSTTNIRSVQADHVIVHCIDQTD